MRRLPHAARQYKLMHRRWNRSPRSISFLILALSLLTPRVASSQFSGQRGGALNPQQNANSPAAPAANDRRRSPVPGLPRNFVPPRPIPDVTKIDKELMTAEEEKAFRPDLVKYQKALIASGLNAESRDLISRGVKFRMYRMTRKEHRPILHILRNDILGKDYPFIKVPEVREYFLDQVTKLSNDMLDNNFYVRLNVVLILGNLKLVEENTRENIAEVAYTPALEVLLKIFDDPNQLEAIKIPTVQGLQRICQIGTPNRDQRLRVAEMFAKELSNPAANSWYQMRLCEGLGWVGIIHDRKPRPFVVQSLALVLVDQTRDWQVRAEAARSLGRAPLDGSINVGLISYAIADLAAQGAEACQKSPPSRTPAWIEFYVTLYLAFQPENAEARSAGHGLLLRNRPASNGAYSQILVLVNHILDEDAADADGKRTFTQDQVTALNEWLVSNPPSNLSVAPGEEPILQSTKKTDVANKNGDGTATP